jgi:hypothetical protein
VDRGSNAAIHLDHCSADASHPLIDLSLGFVGVLAVTLLNPTDQFHTLA